MLLVLIPLPKSHKSRVWKSGIDGVEMKCDIVPCVQSLIDNPRSQTSKSTTDYCPPPFWQ